MAAHRPGHDVDPVHAVRPRRADGVGRAARAQQHFPQPGWVEHDAMEIWRNICWCCRRRCARPAWAIDQVAALGIANQRETTVVWDRAPDGRWAAPSPGRTPGPPTSWSAASRPGPGELFRSVSGLTPDDVLRRTAAALAAGPHARAARAGGRARRGAVRHHGDLADLEPHRRTGRRRARHRRDQRQPHHADGHAHPAAGTRDLLALLDIPAQMLPEIRSNAEVYGTCSQVAAGRAHRRRASATSRRRCSGRPASRPARPSAPTARVRSC